MERTAPHRTIRETTDQLRAARDAYHAAHRRVKLHGMSIDAYWTALDELGMAHRALQRARYAYRSAVGF